MRGERIGHWDFSTCSGNSIVFLEKKKKNAKNKPNATVFENAGKKFLRIRVLPVNEKNPIGLGRNAVDPYLYRALPVRVRTE